VAVLTTRRTVPTALVLALAGLLAGRTSAHAGAVGVGDPLPAITVQDWAGAAASLGDLGGKVTVIDFWASWCSRCRTVLPALDALARTMGPRGVTVLAIDVEDDRATADRFLATHVPWASLTLLRDPHGAALARVGAAGMPALYVVDRDGVVRLVEAGDELDGLDEVVETIERLAPSPPP
jgi:cytochrome c biogenesis protein CcmG/thiol:disulfide interchange protein DsbE